MKIKYTNGITGETTLYEVLIITFDEKEKLYKLHTNCGKVLSAHYLSFASAAYKKMGTSVAKLYSNPDQL